MVRLAALVALGATLGLTAACGSDETAETTSGAGGSANSVAVVAEDGTLSASTFNAEPGTVAVTYRNDGNLEHTLVIEGVDGFKLDVPHPGDVDEGAVELQSGTYVIYCDVVGHREAGMEATLEVA
jgi:uncharacterized cupredoxin-like copper-binding protein